jgi:alpha-2-macroglobulin
MIAGLTGFVEGRVIRRSALPTADLAVRKLAAIEALSRQGHANPRMLDSISIEPNLWPTSAVLDWLGILHRVKGIASAAARRDSAESILRARLNFQGTTMGFSTSRSDALWWLMVSEDSNAVRMLLAATDAPDWRDDVPRLVRGAFGRQQRGHWNTTVANAWGVLAMEKFSTAFEATPVAGTTTVSRGAAGIHQLKWPQPKDTSPTVSLPWDEPGRQAGSNLPLVVRHEGAGKPWIMVRANAALPLDKPVSTGFRITRSMTPVTQQVPGRWTRGDVARVRLELEAQSDMTWVVVDDPVPGGASLLGSGLGGQSQILQRGEQREGHAWPAYEERRFEAFRAYYRFVPKGKRTVEYTMRLNNPGTFALPATRVEAMYAPEMLGELPNAPVTVEPALP